MLQILLGLISLHYTMNVIIKSELHCFFQNGRYSRRGSRSSNKRGVPGGEDTGGGQSDGAGLRSQGHARGRI